jgi:hypothetical protein
MRGRVLRRLLAAVLLASSWVMSGEADAAQIRIREDPGGLISNHVRAFEEARNNGHEVVIDGPCFSACTLALGIIPRERLCATRRARLGFHAAWAFAPDGSKVRSESGTAQLMNIYPPTVRRWIVRKGGLTTRMMVLHGRELASMVRSCR